jgi:ABC-type sugar transport system ATPase subunit
VLVTHDQQEALSMATDLVVMAAGRVVQAEAPGIVYRKPATRFVAAFVGSPAMNLVTTANGGAEGWRPHDARLLDPLEQPTACAIVAGSVDVCEFTGSGQDVVCTRPDGTSFTLVQHEGDTWLRPGDAIRVAIAERAILRFDPDGRRRA